MAENFIFKVLPSLPRSDWSIEVELNDSSLACLSESDFTSSFGHGIANKAVHIKFFVDGLYDAKGWGELLGKLERSVNGNVKIDIYTSGYNFNSIMKCINIDGRLENCSVYIDDHDIRGVFESGDIDFSKVACECHLSRRYLRNLEPEVFNCVCTCEKFIFDREAAQEERKAIVDVWKGENLSSLSSLDKALIIANYINGKIGYANDGKRRIGTIDGRNVYHVEEWASTGIGTLRKGSGVCIGQADLSSLLLDNYLVKVDCRVVEGMYEPTKDPHAWVVVRTEEGNYGICLTKRKRFEDLSTLGYIGGNISLECAHSNRSDYKIPVDTYDKISGALNSSLGTVVYTKSLQ